jgi:hypothetical protein
VRIARQQAPQVIGHGGFGSAKRRFYDMRRSGHVPPPTAR